MSDTTVALAANEAFVGNPFTEPSNARRAATGRFNLANGEFRIAKAGEKAYRIVQIMPEPAEAPEQEEGHSEELPALTERDAMVAASYETSEAQAAMDAELEAEQDEAESPALERMPEQPVDDAQEPSEDSIEAAFHDDTTGFRHCGEEDVMGEDEPDPEAEARERERLERMACALDPRQEGIDWNGVVACEAQSSAGVGLPAWYAKGRTFVLCLEDDAFPQSSPHCWAIEFSRRLGKPVTVRDARTFEALETYDHRAMAKAAGRPAGASPRAVRPAAVKGGGGGTLSEASRQILDMAQRPEGVTYEELTRRNGGKPSCWKATVERLGARRGLRIEVTKLSREDGGVRYRLLPA